MGEGVTKENDRHSEASWGFPCWFSNTMISHHQMLKASRSVTHALAVSFLSSSFWPRPQRHRDTAILSARRSCTTHGAFVAATRVTSLGFCMTKCFNPWHAHDLTCVESVSKHTHITSVVLLASPFVLSHHEGPNLSSSHGAIT